VTRLKFTHDDSHLITVGGSDHCVFQWAFAEDDELDDADVIDESESDSYKVDMRVRPVVSPRTAWAGNGAECFPSLRTARTSTGPRSTRRASTSSAMPSKQVRAAWHSGLQQPSLPEA
jgi:hypothetical protein